MRETTIALASIAAVAALLFYLAFLGHSCEMETRRLKADCLIKGRTAMECMAVEGRVR